MAQKTKLTWYGPTEYVDGTPYGQTDHGGYELEINGQVGIAVPVAWNSASTYELPILGLPNIKQGDNVARIRTVAANGQVSEWTPAVTFQWLSVPKAPTAFAAV